MITVVESVRFRRLLPQLYDIFYLLEAVFRAHGVECVITSANDKTHMQGSLHYTDRALDLRSHDLPSGSEEIVVNELREALGLEYTVLLEDRDNPNEHIHLAWKGMV